MEGLEKFGMIQGAPMAAPTELQAISSPSKAGADQARLTSPENPLFWFGVIGAVTFGLMAFSTEAKIGPIKGSLKVGS